MLGVSDLRIKHHCRHGIHNIAGRMIHSILYLLIFAYKRHIALLFMLTARKQSFSTDVVLGVVVTLIVHWRALTTLNCG